MIADYLDKQGTAKEMVRKFQVDTKHGKIKNFHKNELEEIDEFMEGVPEYPSDYNNEWLIKWGMIGCVDILYHPGKNVTEGWCTRCRKIVQIKDKPKHLKKTKCSCCHVEATYRSWNKQSTVVHYKNVGILQRTLSGEWCLSTTEARVEYKRDEDYSEAHISTGYQARFRLGDSFLQHEAFEYGEYKNTGIHRWNHAKWHGMGYSAYYVSTSCVLYDKNLKKLLNDTELKYMPVVELIRKTNGKTIEIDSFLNNLLNNQEFEKLAKVGLIRLVLENTNRYHYDDALNLKGTTLEQIMRLDKQRIKQAIELNASTKQLKTLQASYKAKVHLSNEDVERICEYFMYGNQDDIYIFLKKGNIVKTLNYLDKIHEERKDLKKYEVRRDYEDYIEQLGILGLPVDKHNRFPANFYQIHEEYSREIRERRDKIAAMDVRKKNMELKKIVKELESLYKLNSKDYVIVWPKSKKDFTTEGQKQHNCVGGYFDRMVKRETVVFFLRRRNEVNKPFCTVEFRNGKMIQCRIAYNNNAPDDVMKIMERISKTYEKELIKAAEQEEKAC